MSPQFSVTPGAGQRGSGHLAVPSAAWWPDSEPVVKPYARGGTRLRVNQRTRGVLRTSASTTLRLGRSAEESQGFKLDSGDPTVQDYRWASGNVAMVELRTRLAIERARTVTLHLKLARWSSIPTR